MNRPKVTQGKAPSAWALAVLKAFQEAVRLAIKEHHDAGRKVPVKGKDGHIEWI